MTWLVVISLHTVYNLITPPPPPPPRLPVSNPVVCSARSHTLHALHIIKYYSIHHCWLLLQQSAAFSSNQTVLKPTTCLCPGQAAPPDGDETVEEESESTRRMIYPRLLGAAS